MVTDLHNLNSYQENPMLHKSVIRVIDTSDICDCIN